MVVWYVTLGCQRSIVLYAQIDVSAQLCGEPGKKSCFAATVTYILPTPITHAHHPRTSPSWVFEFSRYYILCLCVAMQIQASIVQIYVARASTLIHVLAERRREGKKQAPNALHLPIYIPYLCNQLIIYIVLPVMLTPKLGYHAHIARELLGALLPKVATPQLRTFSPGDEAHLRRRICLYFLFSSFSVSLNIRSCGRH